jgi:hypothetical protein
MEKDVGEVVVVGYRWESLRWEFDEFNRKTYAAPELSKDEELAKLRTENAFLMKELREALRNQYGLQNICKLVNSKRKR